MTIVSVNVGLPRPVPWRGMTVETGIFKAPVSGPVMLRELNFDGDRQADLSVHGGPEKAVYAYPSEHYDYWRRELPDMALPNLPWGMFGENLTTVGLDESSVNIGDEFRIGGVIVRVTQPRMPCYKLGIKFGRADMIKRFLDSGRSGFYFSVVEQGVVQAGDSIELIEPIGGDSARLAVADVVRLYAREKNNTDLLRRAISAQALTESWRDYFAQRLNRISSGDSDRS